MWAHAAERSIKYSERAMQYYRNARMHLEHDEMQVRLASQLYQETDHFHSRLTIVG